MTSRHPHADERRRPSLERQLEGAGLFAAAVDALAEADKSDLAKIVKIREEFPAPGPHRVGRRAIAQDRAQGKALIVAGTKIAAILAFLRKDYKLGYTREQIAKALEFKLQTVCGRVNDLLVRAIDGKPAPLVYEMGHDSTGAAYVYAFTPEQLSHSDSRNL